MADGGKSTDLTPQANQLIAQQQGWDKPPSLDQRFGPGSPVLPVLPEEEPRLYEYQPGVNLISMPRSGFGLTPFPVLRNLALASKEIRLNIELIKREIRALNWEIVPKDTKANKAGELNAEIGRATEFFDTPDGNHD